MSTKRVPVVNSGVGFMPQLTTSNSTRGWVAAARTGMGTIWREHPLIVMGANYMDDSSWEPDL